MNEKVLSLLATTLRTKPDVIKEALEDEGKFDSVIAEFTGKYQVFTPEELGRKIENAKQEAVDNLGKDGGELPKHIYNLAKANAFDKVEKDIARDYGIAEYDGLKDLVARAVTKEKNESGKGTDEIVRAKDEKIEDLKSRLSKALEDKEKEITDLRSKFDGELVNMEINSYVDELPIDAEGDTLTNQREVLKTMFKSRHKIDRKEGKTIVSDANGTVLKDRIGDPMGIAEVLKDFAPKWVTLKSDPEGGRGGSSTDFSKSQGLKSITNMDELSTYAESKGIKEGTGDYFDLIMKVKEENPSANL